MKSLVYGVNASSQAFTSGGTISFGSVVRRYGCACNVVGGNLTLEGAGYYDIDTNIGITSTDAGNGVLTFYKDGVAIPGATATFTTTAGGVFDFSIPFVVRTMCCKETVITAVLSGISGTVTNAAIVARKD